MKDRSIEVSQERAIQELEEIPVEKNIKEDLRCTFTMHTRPSGTDKLITEQATVPVCCNF